MFDEDLPRRESAPLKALAVEDLEPYSIEALNERIARLEAEIARARQAIAAKTTTRSAADALFRKS